MGWKAGRVNEPTHLAPTRGGRVEAVALSPTHTMSKPAVARVRLLAGLGIEGDAHLGVTVKHRSRVAQDPTQPNLRQVHLVHAELHDRLRRQGIDVAAGEMGENITTRGIDLLGLPTYTRLHIGDQAVIEVMGLRNPCRQLEGLHAGLQAAVLERDESGELVRLAGVMAVVLTDGYVHPGDLILVSPPARETCALRPV